MLALIGPSGCGKTTIEQELIKRGYKRAISCTTRAPRKGEKHGLNYYYITEDKFKEDLEMGLMGEFTLYKGHYYGLPLCELADDAVVVVEPNGYRQLKSNKKFNVCGCYLYCDEDIRRKRMLDRGDEPTQVEERISNDREWFKNIEKEVEIIVDTTNKTINEVIESILKGGS